MGGDSVTTDPSIRSVLTPSLTRMLAGLGASSLGGGLTMALFVVYLHSVREFSLQTAGLVLTYQALLGLVLAPLVGVLVDRIGPQPVLLVACLVEAAATFAFGLVTTVPQAIGVATVMAVGNAGTWPPQAALLSRLSRPETRQRVFGLQFMLLNLGLGLGGLVGASILDVTHPATFTAMYTINALSYVAYFVAVATLRGVSGPEAHPPDEGDGPGGYREVMGDARLRRYVLGALVMLTCGYGSMDSGLPAFMTTVAHLPVNAIGVVFFLNTLIIVVAQVWVLKRIEGRSRTRLLSVAALVWGSFWLVVALSAGFTPVVAGIMIALGFGVFALGEMIFSPVGPSLINSFAPPHLRGRYNAVGGLTWGVSSAIGPAVAGVVIGGGWGVAWALGLALGCVVAAVILYSLRGLLTPEEDGRTGPGVARAAEVGG
ncbi:MAG: MFS transporter [Actinomycetales bacterium]|nr:MFS transporter [Actinomycetales bacterium]